MENFVCVCVYLKFIFHIVIPLLLFDVRQFCLCVMYYVSLCSFCTLRRPILPHLCRDVCRHSVKLEFIELTGKVSSRFECFSRTVCSFPTDIELDVTPLSILMWLNVRREQIIFEKCTLQMNELMCMSDMCMI